MIRRLVELLRALPASLARMGGYWGGVVMRAVSAVVSPFRR